jgi:hypothetical protein
MPAEPMERLYKRPALSGSVRRPVLGQLNHTKTRDPSAGWIRTVQY